MGLEREASTESPGVAFSESVTRYYQSGAFKVLLSSNTQTAYRQDLSRLDQYLKERRISLLCQIKDGHIRGFLQQFTPGTSNRRRAGLKKYFMWANTQGEIGQNPIENIPHLETEPHLLLDYLSQRDVTELLAKAKKNKRDLVLITLMLGTGVNISEILGLNVEDVSLANPDLVSLKFAKRTKKRTVLIQDKERVIRTYLGTIPESGPFFRGYYEPHQLAGRERLTRQGTWLLVQNYGEKIGRPNLSPRVLRYTFLMNFSGQTEELSEDLGVTISSTIKLVARQRLTMAESSQTPQIPEP